MIRHWEPIAACAVALVLMALETLRSLSNERQLRGAGAVEPARDVHHLMAWSYPAAFLAMTAEAVVSGVPRLESIGLVLFVLAKALKYWAIATLGPRWCFRILVPPGSARITTGPYRWLNHPNYFAVFGELVGFGIMVGAGWVGALSAIWFVALMRRRVLVEERALGG